MTGDGDGYEKAPDPMPYVDAEHEHWWRTALKRTFEFRWDADAKVWVITSPDVPGLATEADTIPDGLRRAADAVQFLTKDRDEGPR